MSTPVRLAAFAVLLVAIGVAGFGVGSITGPVGPAGEPPAHSSTQTEEHS